ncbi:uncharacterized protein LOC125676078 [Ostrea edulis]|uniref:uncharacterized protein LOC125676078 n=1 Tax=Ostrea edulis TaxID=37623 RepID=UPI0024AF4C52|nr:uncharacterized protein LOC125676078 [Ostrea edulis]
MHAFWDSGSVMAVGSVSFVALCISILLVLTSGVQHHHHHRTTTTPIPTTTTPPLPDTYEYGNSLFYYDSVSHYLCCGHNTRLNRVCMCYHVPYTDREAINDPEKVLEIEKRIYTLYDAGHHAPTSDLNYYSATNYKICMSHSGGNVTIELVYD